MKSNKPKHTPGPWIAAIDPGVTTVDGNKCKVFHANGPMFMVLDGVKDYSEQVANARLISAAPEMLEALERLVERVTQLNPDAKAACLKQLDEAKVAIAKARGES